MGSGAHSLELETLELENGSGYRAGSKLEFVAKLARTSTRILVGVSLRKREKYHRNTTKKAAKRETQEETQRAEVQVQQ